MLSSRLAPVVVLAAAAIASQYARSFLAVIAPDLMADLGISAVQFGWLTTAFFLAFAAAQVPVGMSFDRFGVKSPTVMLMLVGAASLMLFAVAPNAAIATAA